MVEADRGVATHRPRPPDRSGVVDRDGVAIAYDVYDADRPTLLLMPTWAIVDSRVWKLQLPYLARHFRVVTFDGRGSGRSGRPAGAAAYEDLAHAEDAVAVLDATDTERALLVGFSCGVAWSVHVAARHPDRVTGIVAIATSCQLDVPDPHRDEHPFDARLPTTEGWASYNEHHWLEGGLDDFHDFFFRQVFPEPHSTKQVEDFTGWARQVPARTLVDTTAGRLGLHGAAAVPLEPACAQVRCPVLVVHGTHDLVRTPDHGRRLAELTGGELVLLDGVGHAPPARQPVSTNLLVRDFAERVHPRPLAPVRPRPVRRPRRVLFLSSPIGLGHARRDLAIARALREAGPDVEVEWLTQHPVSDVLRRAGETVHPASDVLASEAVHVEDECGEHDLHAFEAIRRMDELLVHNFMVFHEAVSEGEFDLVVGDEAWEVDHLLHENPALKRTAFAWLTDFVGWLPMPSGGDREARLTADLNAEMIEHRARHAQVRDRSIFVGTAEDVVDRSFGPGLPDIRTWTAAHFDFAGYVSGFEPPDESARSRVRARLGCRDDELLCVVSVGGSGVGGALLRRVLDAAPLARRLVPGLRFLLVCGPRIDPRSLPRRRGVTAVGYVPDLVDHLAAADLAVVQGGLTTCMELAACRRPFLYVPLENHFEQQFHVRHRLERYGAGRCLPYEAACDPEVLAQAIAATVGAEVRSLPVETDGAARAAALLADLL